MADLSGLPMGWCLYRAEDGGWTVGVIGGYEDSVSPLASASTVEEAIAAAFEQAARDEAEAAERRRDYERRKATGALTWSEHLQEDMVRGVSEAVLEMVTQPTVMLSWLRPERDA